MNFGSIHLKHGDSHNKDQEGGNQVEYALNEELSEIGDGLKLQRSLPSQSSSEEAQRSEALVNQTAMKAAPMANAMRSPRDAPANIYGRW